MCTHQVVSKTETTNKECQKTFIQKSNIIQHVRHHINFKPYECLVCRKRFVSSSNMSDHVRRHYNIRPYECKNCNRKYFRNADLTKHICNLDEGILHLNSVLYPDHIKLPPFEIFMNRVQSFIN